MKATAASGHRRGAYYDAASKNVDVHRWLDADIPGGDGYYNGVGKRLSLRGSLESLTGEEDGYYVQENDPIRAIEGLSYVERVEHLLSGLYRVVFHNTTALVDLERLRVAISRGEHMVNEYAAVAAAFGYQALYETAQPTKESRTLAAAFYKFGEGEELVGEDYAEMAWAAGQLLRARGGTIEINGDNLMEMLVPESVPIPHSALRLQNGDETALDQVWEEYVQAMRQFIESEKSESPEVDLQELAHYETALAAYGVAAAMHELEIENVRAGLCREIFGVEAKPMGATEFDNMNTQVADAVRTYLRYTLDTRDNDREAQERELRNSSKGVCSQQMEGELGGHFRERVLSDQEFLKRVLPAPAQAHLRALDPNCSSKPAELLVSGKIPRIVFDEYMCQRGANGQTLPALPFNWERLQKASIAAVEHAIRLLARGQSLSPEGRQW